MGERERECLWVSDWVSEVKWDECVCEWAQCNKFGIIVSFGIVFNTFIYSYVRASVFSIYAIYGLSIAERSSFAADFYDYSTLLDLFGIYLQLFGVLAGPHFCFFSCCCSTQFLQCYWSIALGKIVFHFKALSRTHARKNSSAIIGRYFDSFQ